MKKNIFFLSLISLGIFSCTPTKTTENQSISQSDTLAVASTESFSPAGNSFAGTLPCASCPGIETRISFNADGTLTKETLYLENDVFPAIEKGKWQIKDNKIKTELADDTSVYVMKSANEIAMLDADEKEITGEMANNYKLTKLSDLPATEISGIYLDGEKTKGAYNQLTIANTTGTEYAVEFTSGNVKKGCSFKGKGTLKNNRIVVHLPDYQKDMKADMTITFQNKQASVYVNNPEHKYDLMYFCGGGGSLMGEYKKQ